MEFQNNPLIYRVKTNFAAPKPMRSAHTSRDLRPMFRVKYLHPNYILRWYTVSRFVLHGLVVANRGKKTCYFTFRRFVSQNEILGVGKYGILLAKKDRCTFRNMLYFIFCVVVVGCFSVWKTLPVITYFVGVVSRCF
ncbi:hypothetical protein CEXT_476371 [Caerostris extrusa]|uniref:Uncharacterized protein n=1 Tax=Caerostris extrusa TaxID=172846 RepID=A0AAV4WXN5_CAEEX|nr:hypothetical protein CEXT_476371 [Caerostris extrusa]